MKVRVKCTVFVEVDLPDGTDADFATRPPVVEATAGSALAARSQLSTDPNAIGNSSGSPVSYSMVTSAACVASFGIT